MRKTLRNALMPIAVTIAFVLAPVVAQAQDEELPPPPDGEEELPAPPDGEEELPAPPGDEEAAAPAETERPSAPVESEAEAMPTQEDAAESAAQQTLESDETIYVIEDKPYTIGGRFELSPQFVMSFNDRFTNHYGFLVTAMYHLRENVGVESAGGYLFGLPSEITNEIKEKGRLAPEPVDLYALTWVATANVQWTPIYGKVSVLDMVLGHYGLYFSVGGGVTGLQLERYFDAPGQTYDLPLPLAPTSTIGGGLRIYFMDWLGMRLEVRDYVQANSVSREITNFPFSYFDVQNYYMIQLGASFIF